MQILVIGASKGIGRQTVKRGVTRGHQIRAMSRQPAADLPEHVEPFAGDALNSEDLGRAVVGMDAVISTLGIKETPAMLWQEVHLFSDSTAALIPAMEAAGVARLIVVTGFGAGDSRAAMSWIERTGHGLILGKPYADKTRQEALIQGSDLDWTIARPVILTNGQYTGKIGIHSESAKWRNGLISRADVAGYLIDAVETGRDLRQAVVLRREG
ncbi:MAG: NAD(P)H-binding protein [Pseudomonadota bacterium]